MAQALSEHHPIFARFAGARFTHDPAMQRDYIGAGFRGEFNGLPPLADRSDDTATLVRPPPPGFNEEYFEWIDILEAVEEARDSFLIIELGAGYGRWSVRALVAARQRGLASARAVAVEADPIHAAWCRRAFLDNALGVDQHEVIEAAVADAPGERHFLVEAPDASLTPATWYGQSLANPNREFKPGEGGGYAGREVFTRSSWGTIKVPAITLDSLLERESYVDVIDMDVQGEELRVVESSLDALNAKVRRLHIGTHSAAIDGGLIATLGAAGWRNVRTYLCGQRQETPYGLIDFQDGVQTWLNPAFDGRDSGR